tara:strand:- start:8690 stop:8947 length:258 start_codon:yes stop_codon:yes gene_type:complete
MDFKIGDLVKPTKDYADVKKHTARQCKIGIIISYDKFQGNLLYKVYWWPYNSYFYFPEESLSLVSRVDLQDSETLKPLPLIKKPT